ncbi:MULTISPECIES: hypothetical protein [unclassified Mesorhizobium]|uniref:hypothetical protein n=1 Tax=unclassified Mesorhizobium TaxID=325217 RepID=UPI001211369A|nr:MULTISPECIES: hypothetical protein [unclassified Mesorhizobium]MDG4887881.1 hypothetical protein [Mesorhizobium sp. WSM4887]TIQ07637.1 MAG: hypothetical protein E5X50_14830 [Mesorhizobium sp.]
MAVAPVLHDLDPAMIAIIPVIIAHHITLAIGRSVVVVIVDVSVIAVRVIPAIVVTATSSTIVKTETIAARLGCFNFVSIQAWKGAKRIASDRAH